MTAASVTAELWGKFLIALFECWVRADISRISIELLTPPYKMVWQRKPAIAP